VIFALMALYPSIEARVTGDRRQHNELDLPRDHPVRTGIGVAALGFYLMLLFAGGEDVISTTFGISLNHMVWGLRIACILVPPAAFLLTYNWCRGLQQDDDDLLIEGRATGVLLQEPSGEYVEVHTPLPVEPVPDRRFGDPESVLAEPSPHEDTATYHAMQLFKVARRNLRHFFIEESEFGPVPEDRTGEQLSVEEQRRISHPTSAPQ
jgi:ubiquinol-cytochrome c reductase cytochrome b subunit